MMPSTTLPVILLAFANNRIESRHYLRNLPEEHRRIRDILRQAQEQSLCEVVDLPNATTAEIVRTFQQPQYRNRIAIFHFGGHASGFSLMLEDAAGKPTAAGAIGLAEFLGVQKSLQLVFLNGCSTLGQTEGLLNAGVGAVISTSTAINDEVATGLACRFYEGLATGADLENAFAEATSAARMEAGESTRALYAVDDVGELVTDQLPWHLTIRPGAEPVARWNLPQEAQNPLYGLPPLPQLELEPSPFRNIRWFQREHAELFFGRGREIRDLYQKATSPATAPIILFYGQAGTGKSSLLDAGLLPRLEQSQSVSYLRRDQEQGLLGTLRLGLRPEGLDISPGSAWRAREATQDRPLTLVMDQVEELYSRPCGSESEEWRSFLDALLDIFHDGDKRPRGRLILGFRKEWLAEIKRQVTEARLPFTEVFLEDLSRQGIMEAVQGPARAGRLKNQYHLSVEPGLAEIIADDLLDDKTGTNAPTLQVLLSRFWEFAHAQNPTAPTFTQAMYSNLKKDGILLRDFLDRQLHSVEEMLRAHVSPDLILDVLAQHTTPLGMSNQCRVDELRRGSPIPVGDYDKLIQCCLQAYLLIEPAAGGGKRGEFTRLSHDTLGPLIRHRFESSDLPGQRARRILEARSSEWDSEQEGTPLDEPDLKVVETGKLGMRSWSRAEQRLIVASQLARTSRRHWNKILKIAGAIAIVLILGSAFFANWQRNAAITEKKAAEESKRQTESTLARSFLMAFLERPADSIEKLPLSPGELGTAWELASIESERVREEVLRAIGTDPRFGERVAHRAEILTQSLVGIDLERRARMLQIILRVSENESPRVKNGSVGILDWKVAIGLGAIVQQLQFDDENLLRFIASTMAQHIDITKDPRSVGKIANELVAYRSSLHTYEIKSVYERLLQIDLSSNSQAFPPQIGVALIGLAPVIAENDLIPLLKIARERWDAAGSGLTLQQTMEEVFVHLSARVPPSLEVEAWKILSLDRRIPGYMGAPSRWNEALIQLATRSPQMAQLAFVDMLEEYRSQGPTQLAVLREAYAALTPEDQGRYQNDINELSDLEAWKNYFPPLPLSRDAVRRKRALQEAADNLSRRTFSEFSQPPGDDFCPTPDQISEAQRESATQIIDHAIQDPNDRSVQATSNAIDFLQLENRLPMERIGQLSSQISHLFDGRMTMKQCESGLKVLILAGQPISEELASTMVHLIRKDADLAAQDSFSFASSFQEDDLRNLISLIPKKFHTEIAQISLQAANQSSRPYIRLEWIRLINVIPQDHIPEKIHSTVFDLTFSLYGSALEDREEYQPYLLKDFPSQPWLSEEQRAQLVQQVERQWWEENNYFRLAMLSRMRWNLNSSFAADSVRIDPVNSPLSFSLFFNRLCQSLYHLPPPMTNSSPPMNNTFQPGELADAIRLTLSEATSEDQLLAANAALYVIQHAVFLGESGPSLKRLLQEVVSRADSATMAALMQSPWCVAEGRAIVLEAWGSASKQPPSSNRWKQLDAAHQAGRLPMQSAAPIIPSALLNSAR